MAALNPDILQLHGSETPSRLREIKARHGLTIMKAIGIAEPEDALKALLATRELLQRTLNTNANVRLALETMFLDYPLL